MAAAADLAHATSTSTPQQAGAEWPSLILTCGLMFLAAFGCGSLPSWLPSSSNQQQREQTSSTVSAIGAGLLLGSALCIILPEGFEAAMQGSEHPPPGWAVSGTLLGGFWLMLLLDSLSHWLPGSSHSSHNSHSGAAAAAAHADTNSSCEEHTVLLTDFGSGRQQQQQQQHPAGASSGGGPSSSSPTKSRAAARAGSSRGDSSRVNTGRAEAAAAAAAGSNSAADLSFTSSSRDRLPTAAAAAGGPSSSSAAAGGGGVTQQQEWWRPWLVDPTHHALLGLLVHSVSDGLAVGAASLSSLPAVSLGVATAMVIHKGPVALGLATFLQGAAWTPQQVQRGLLLFAAASPLAALLTAGVLSSIPGVTESIPLVVLFSGGTVLYAATMHILPSAMSTGGRAQLPWVTLGMLVPLVLGAVAFGGESGGGGHHHHHG